MQVFAAVWQVGPALYPVEDPALLEPLNHTLAARAHETSSVLYAQALHRLNVFSRRVVAFWGDYDLLLTPTLAKEPVPIGWLQEEPDPWQQFGRSAEFTPFTPVVNVTGLPAVSVPFAWSESGLPIGVQLIGRPAAEATLIRVSAQLEEARPWRDRRPALEARAGA
jgi:amidase